mmetsp:Transcript_12435/g.36677  ORF Transcript_12435/g.36677 Transcript_12435/m.36677 type:complete len:201 (+) Transcript_12435:1-603(+)
MFAATNGHERVVELLLQRGAEINLQDSKIGAPPRRPMGHRPSAGITGWSPMHPGARRQRPLPRACLHPPGGARTPARRLISWGPPAIWPTRAHPQAHCSTEAPANTARRLGRGSMTSPATHADGLVRAATELWVHESSDLASTPDPQLALGLQRESWQEGASAAAGLNAFGETSCGESGGAGRRRRSCACVVARVCLAPR